MDFGKFQNLSIQIVSDPTDTFGAEDSVRRYPVEDKSKYRPSTKIGIRLIDVTGQTRSSAILTGYDGSSGVHKTCGLLDSDSFVLCVGSSLFCLEIPSLALRWNVQVDEATCLAVYQIPGGYIVHGELEISRVSREGKIIWQRGGSDIFITPEGTSDFKITNDQIIARDWSGKVYRFGFNGEEIPAAVISSGELYELYTDTLNRCGSFILEASDEEIEYQVFEEFDIGVHSFFHDDALERLLSEGFISKAKKEKSAQLREKVIELQRLGEWKLESVKKTVRWKDLFSLADQIKGL